MCLDCKQLLENDPFYNRKRLSNIKEDFENLRVVVICCESYLHEQSLKTKRKRNVEDRK